MASFFLALALKSLERGMKIARQATRKSYHLLLIQRACFKRGGNTYLQDEKNDSQ